MFPAAVLTSTGYVEHNGATGSGKFFLCYCIELVLRVPDLKDAPALHIAIAAQGNMNHKCQSKFDLL